jgi:hypothetical protein
VRHQAPGERGDEQQDRCDEDSGKNGGDMRLANAEQRGTHRHVEQTERGHSTQRPRSSRKARAPREQQEHERADEAAARCQHVGSDAGSHSDLDQPTRHAPRCRDHQEK